MAPARRQRLSAPHATRNRRNGTLAAAAAALAATATGVASLPTLAPRLGPSLPRPTPVKQVYIDWRNINATAPASTVTAAVDAGYNVVAIAFLLVTGPADFAAAWESAGAAVQAAAVAYAHAAGAVVVVSCGGVTDVPYTMAAADYGAYVANWALDNNLDGVDLDLEGLGSGFTAGPIVGNALVTWMVDATTAARAVLGPARYLTHSPVAPYFGYIGAVRSAHVTYA